MLKITGLSVAYGGLHALEDVSLEVAEGEFVTIVGPNGAGKTTLLRAISGSVRSGAGRLEFRGRDMTPLAAHQRAALGIAHVPEGRRIFPTLTVLENLELGSYRRGPRAAPAAGGLAVRRRAADAGAGAGPHGAAGPPAPRRAVPGARPADRRADLRDHRPNPEEPPPDHPARRAARGRGPGALRPRLCPRNRARRAGRGSRRAPRG